jgi:hypothetical protein
MSADLMFALVFHYDSGRCGRQAFRMLPWHHADVPRSEPGGLASRCDAWFLPSWELAGSGHTGRYSSGDARYISLREAASL